MSRANALKDDRDWCGHTFVSLRTWACAEEGCARPVTPETRSRLEAASPVAPRGSVWVLTAGPQELVDDDGMIYGLVDGVFTNRARIGWLMVRNLVCGADDIRDVMRRTHWYQGAFNHDLFEGWEEEPDERGSLRVYSLSLETIDRL